MIYNRQLTKELNKDLEKAIDFLHYGLGSKYDIQIIHGKLTESRFEALEKQGGNLVDVNRLREKQGLHKINQDRNFKVMKKGWGKNLLDGTGCVFAIQSRSFRYKLTDEIKNVLEWFKQEQPMFKIEPFETPKFHLFFIHLKKEKQETKTDETPVQIPDPSL